MAALSTKIQLNQATRADLEQDLQMLGRQVSSSELNKLVSRSGFRFYPDGAASLILPLASEVLLSGYRGSAESDHAEASYLTHAVTVAILHYGFTKGEATRNEVLRARGANAFHEFDVGLLDLEGRHRYVDPNVSLAFRYGEPLPEYARKRTIAFSTSLVAERLQALFAWQAAERRATQNLMRLMQWIAAGEVPPNQLEPAIEFMRQQIQLLRQACGLKADYVEAVFGALDEPFFVSLRSTYRPASDNRPLLQRLLTEAMAAQSVVSVATRNGTPAQRTAHPWLQTQKTLLDYLEYQAHVRAGTFEDVDLSSIHRLEVPAPLQAAVDHDVLLVDGDTLGEIVDRLRTQTPASATQLFDPGDQSQLRAGVTLALGEDQPELIDRWRADWRMVEIRGRSINVQPQVAGGSPRSEEPSTSVGVSPGEAAAYLERVAAQVPLAQLNTANPGGASWPLKDRDGQVLSTRRTREEHVRLEARALDALLTGDVAGFLALDPETGLEQSVVEDLSGRIGRLSERARTILIASVAWHDMGYAVPLGSQAHQLVSARLAEAELRQQRSDTLTLETVGLVVRGHSDLWNRINNLFDARLPRGQHFVLSEPSAVARWITSLVERNLLQPADGEQFVDELRTIFAVLAICDIHSSGDRHLTSEAARRLVDEAQQQIIAPGVPPGNTERADPRSGLPPALIPWLWGPLIQWLEARGLAGPWVGSLGVVERAGLLGLTAALSTGLQTLGLDSVSSLVLAAPLVGLLLPLAHRKSIYALTGRGTFSIRPPTPLELRNITRIGVAFQLLCVVSSLALSWLSLPISLALVSWLAAIPALAAHGFFDVRRLRRQQDQLKNDFNETFNAIQLTGGSS
jgi:hypothetical protein